MDKHVRIAIQICQQFTIVPYCLGNLTLEEWQAQVVMIMAGAQQTENLAALPELQNAAKTLMAT